MTILHDLDSGCGRRIRVPQVTLCAQVADHQP
jgi:hypothetical protein